MSNPKVSIIIPVYNGSDFLGEAIESALSQTYENLEVIVVNDGSTDGGKTEEKALSYGDKIRYFSKENGGVSSALNLGIEKMEGEWFSWLSHDDLYLSNKIETQMRYVKNNPEARYLAGGTYLIESDGKIIIESTTPSVRIVSTGREFLEAPLNGCTMLIHRECFQKAGLFNINNRTTQDAEEWVKIMKFYPVHFLPDIIVKCRIHPGAGSFMLKERCRKDLHNFFKMLLEEFDVSWFYPPGVEKNHSEESLKKLKMETYEWMGNNAIARGGPEAAYLCFKYANKVLSSPLHLSFYSNIAGEKFFITGASLYISHLEIKKKIYRFFWRLKNAK
jgi:glycosyltransferase involved in cell wall biosynthesis